MQSIQIWRALPDETSLDNLIGDISVTAAWPPMAKHVCVSVRQPKHLAGDNYCIFGSVGELSGYLAEIHAQGVAGVLARDVRMSSTEPMLDAEAGSHPLTLSVFDCGKERRELAQLTIIPRTDDLFLCDATWSLEPNRLWRNPTDLAINRVLTVRFWPPSVTPWTVLRAVTNLLAAGSGCGGSVSAFHYSVADDLSALPRASGLK